MATIVLVHGIAQEQRSADSLEAQWIPALAGGVRSSGNPALADRLWRNGRPGDIDVRMAYYGNKFLDEGAQGASPMVGLNEAALELAEELAKTWLETAAQCAGDDRDRCEAQNQLHVLTRGNTGAMGPKATLRPAINGLARLRWFAPFGVGLAGRFVWRALAQVSRYLTDDETRAYAQQQVLERIGVDTRLVIGHSLGSVVAYEALHQADHPTALLTLGSPLGLRTVVYDRLRPHPAHVPPTVTRWDNLVDRDDLVAAQLDLAPYFPPAAGSTIAPVTASSLDNGAEPHDAEHYLNKKTTGRIIGAAVIS
ncbi:hypothetical protein [Mycobacterium sp. 1245852.3]|uniref:hypothetical protein n=1 Tax=Mycobacterium sp. 1245852.3 TaxID=1856860 RepID=UPI0007FF291D|nr:hypothetical protein [Mycobacterium sp. 1245852.3]OBJ97961.1 hypothetical protein A9W96_18905 [Mycobacterium sp. 1245852.3]